MTTGPLDMMLRMLVEDQGLGWTLRMQVMDNRDILIDEGLRDQWTVLD